jgi:hypothetical protein
VPDPFEELSFTHKCSKRSHSNPNGIPPQSPRLGGRTYPGNKVQKAFSTPKVLRQSSAIWMHPRWGCFEQGHQTQGRPTAVAEGQPWAGGRNPVGIEGGKRLHRGLQVYGQSTAPRRGTAQAAYQTRRSPFRRGYFTPPNQPIALQLLCRHTIA